MTTTFYKDTDLAQRFGVSRVTIWRWVKNNQFPAPVRFSVGCTRWNSDDIDKWQSDCESGFATMDEIHNNI